MKLLPDQLSAWYVYGRSDGSIEEYKPRKAQSSIVEISDTTNAKTEGTAVWYIFLAFVQL